jgi:hypothetical protein
MDPGAPGPSRAEVTDAAMSGRAASVILNKGPFIAVAIAFLGDGLARMGVAHQNEKTAMLRRLQVSGDAERVARRQKSTRGSDGFSSLLRGNRKNVVWDVRLAHPLAVSCSSQAGGVACPTVKCLLRSSVVNPAVLPRTGAALAKETARRSTLREG